MVPSNPRTTVWFGIALSVLVLFAGALYVRRLRSLRSGRGPEVTDEMVRRIERSGRIEVDDPLDIEEIRREEERFWSESPWEEPDQW